MSEESRLGREQLEVGYALKQIISAGVRVFFYLEDRERTLDTPIDKIMLSLTAFADELEREKASQRTYDAMLRKARAGHVTGGRVFGYDNVELVGPDGRRSHVVRRINDQEASIVRRIFDMCVNGNGYTRISKALNAEDVPCPRPQQGRPSGWTPSSVHEILKRPLYVGSILWNRTKKRNQWGEHRQSIRPSNEWMTIPAPQLRVVSEGVWDAARAPRRHQGATRAGCREVAWRPTSGHRLPVPHARILALWGLRRRGVRDDAQARQEPATVLRLRVEPQARRLRVQQPDDRPDEPCRCRRIRAPRR